MQERLALRERPSAPHVMYQDWLELLFVHYTMDPDALQALLPEGLTVDTFPDAQGRERAWIGAVPFRMRNVRPRFVPPFPWLSAFLETNLRTYVHHEGHGPAVYFFSLDAANAIACAVARATFALPYHHAAMSSQVQAEAPSDNRDHTSPRGQRFDYETIRKRGGSYLRTSFTVGEAIGEAEPGTLDFFLAERYLLVTPRKRGGLWWGRVHHSPYQLRHATLHSFDETLSQAAGLPGMPRGWEQQAEHVCYCEGVSTRVWPIRRAPPHGQPAPA